MQASIYGVEKKPLPHLLATTNMILHGIEVPNQIRHDNTLARPLISWGRRSGSTASSLTHRSVAWKRTVSKPTSRLPSVPVKPPICFLC